MGSSVTERKERTSRNATVIIDCDVHNGLQSREALKPYLASRWHPYYEQGSHIAGHIGQIIGAKAARDLHRQDAHPTVGPPGSDYPLLCEQLLDRHNVIRAILTPLESLAFPSDGDLASALITALNTWMVEEWFERDSRLVGAISISQEDGLAAAAEIERAAADPRFVGVLHPPQTREGLGHAKYWPIYEVAEARGLPLILHIGGFSGTHMSTGSPEYYLERRTGHPEIYQAQLISAVYSGIFDRFPNLQFVLEESSVAWLPSLLWRLDRTWNAMREHAPHLERQPSAIVREHFWMTTQPFDEPLESRQLLQMLEHMGMNDRLLYASDYPHRDFDDPGRVLPASLIGKELHEQIFRHNAERCFAFSDA